MFLHEAIKTILDNFRSEDRLVATTSEICGENRRLCLYIRKKDGMSPDASQINARVRKHPELFQFTGRGKVTLR